MKKNNVVRWLGIAALTVGLFFNLQYALIDYGMHDNTLSIQLIAQTNGGGTDGGGTDGGGTDGGGTDGGTTCDHDSYYAEGDFLVYHHRKKAILGLFGSCKAQCNISCKVQKNTWPELPGT